MRIRNGRTAAVVGLTTALIVGLSACSSESPHTAERSPETEKTDSKAPGSKTPEGTKSPFSATVDDQPFNIDEPITNCVSEAGATTIHTASTIATNGDYFSVIIDDSGQVSMLMASQKGETVLDFMDVAEVGHAEATIDGKTYTVKGEAPGTVSTDPSAPLKKVEMTATCS